MKTNVFRYSILFSLILITQNHLSAAQQPYKQTGSSSQTNKPWFKCTFQGCYFSAIEKEYLDSHITRVHNNQSINQAQISQICEPLLYITRDGRLESSPMQTQITRTSNNESNAEVYQRAATTVLLSPTEDVALRFKCPFEGCLFGAKEKKYLNSHITKVHKNKSNSFDTMVAPAQNNTVLPSSSLPKEQLSTINLDQVHRQTTIELMNLEQSLNKHRNTSQSVQPSTHQIQLIEYEKTQTADTMDVDKAEDIRSGHAQDELDDNMQQDNDPSGEDSETLSETEIENIQKS